MSLKVDDYSGEKMGDGMRIRGRQSQISRDLPCLCNEYDETEGRRDGGGIIKRSGDGTYCRGYYAILFLPTAILRVSGARVGMLI